MSKQLFITRCDPELSSAALFEGSRLVNYFSESTNKRSQVGGIYRGKVRRVVSQMQAVFVDIGLPEPGFLAARDAGKAANSKSADLDAIFREGQTIWVQVSKDEIQSIDGLSAKGVRLTTELSLDTAHLVYLPNSHTVGVSKQIENEQKRTQLKTILQESIAEQKIAGGFIIRSILNSSGEASWVNDAALLWSQWQNIKQEMRKATKVGLIYQAPGLLSRLAQSIVTQQLDRVSIVREAEEFFQKNDVPIDVVNAEEMAVRLKDLDFQAQLNQAMNPLVELTDGGSIVIEKTEALIVIDVNMGSAVQKQISVLQLNLMAAKLIAEQVRLRNLSGMIVVDFINMPTREDKALLLQNFQQLMSEDVVRVQVYGYTRLDLVELSRERIYPSLYEMNLD